MAASVVLFGSLVAAGCGSPTEPTPRTPLELPPLMATQRVSIIDGWTGAMVPNVRVRTRDIDVVADGAGHVVLEVWCAPATFTAAGFLERRVRCLLNTVGGGNAVTLWPVRDDRESEATRRAVFAGGMATAHPESIPTYLSAELQAPDVLPTWQAAAAEVQRLTRNRWLTVRNGGPGVPSGGEDAYIVAPSAEPSRCDQSGWSVPFEQFGFCMVWGPGYWQTTLRVPESRLTAPDVALRALLVASGARDHDMPGILNTQQPSGTVSEFERKTLHMIGLRGRIGWPDDELCQQCS
jgi:hypothetical protein